MGSHRSYDRYVSWRKRKLWGDDEVKIEEDAIPSSHLKTEAQNIQVHDLVSYAKGQKMVVQSIRHVWKDIKRKRGKMIELVGIDYIIGTAVICSFDRGRLLSVIRSNDLVEVFRG